MTGDVVDEMWSEVACCLGCGAGVPVCAFILGFAGVGDHVIMQVVNGLVLMTFLC